MAPLNLHARVVAPNDLQSDMALTQDGDAPRQPWALHANPIGRIAQELVATCRSPRANTATDLRCQYLGEQAYPQDCFRYPSEALLTNLAEHRVRTANHDMAQTRMLDHSLDNMRGMLSPQPQRRYTLEPPLTVTANIPGLVFNLTVSELAPAVELGLAGIMACGVQNLVTNTQAWTIAQAGLVGGASTIVNLQSELMTADHTCFIMARDHLQAMGELQARISHLEGELQQRQQGDRDRHVRGAPIQPRQQQDRYREGRNQHQPRRIRDEPRDRDNRQARGQPPRPSGPQQRPGVNHDRREGHAGRRAHTRSPRSASPRRGSPERRPSTVRHRSRSRSRSHASERPAASGGGGSQQQAQESPASSSRHQSQ